MTKVHVSDGNTKIGKTMNVSLTPVDSCITGAPCAKQCYARNPYRRFKLVKQHWDSNYRFAKRDPEGFILEISKVIYKKKPKWFRWHVSGDIPSGEYLANVVALARGNPETEFELFTKRYDLLDKLDLRKVPSNLHIVASVWPGLGVPRSVMQRYPLGFYRNEKMPDPRIPSDAFTCPGKCEKCRRCWSMRKTQSVVFNHH